MRHWKAKTHKKIKKYSFTKLGRKWHRNKTLWIAILLLIPPVGAFIASNNSSFLTAALHKKADIKKAPSPKVLASPQPTVSPTTVPSPTIKPIYYTPTKPLPTPTPMVYENYGWYMHDGQVMQYFNGSWFTTPQQDNTPTPVPPNPDLKNCPGFLIGTSFCDSCKRSDLTPQACLNFFRRH